MRLVSEHFSTASLHVGIPTGSHDHFIHHQKGYLVLEGKVTISYALQWGSEQLKASGVETPQLDAEVLLAHCLHLDRTTIYLSPGRCLSQEERMNYLRSVERRKRREPVAYIMGGKEFHSLQFKLTPAVLIPRPETETLVEETVREGRALAKRRHPVRMLELGTGSGSIAVSVAHEIPMLSLIATDSSLEAVKVAKENSLLHKKASHILFVVADYLHALTVKHYFFDLVVSNPPYLSTADWEKVAPEIAQYEPYSALVAGDDGVEFYREVVPDAGRLLGSGGWLLLEVGNGQAEAVSAMIKDTGDFIQILSVKDLAGIPRVVKAQKK